MQSNLVLIGFATIDLAGTEVLVNVMACSGVCFGEMNSENAELWGKNRIGGWYKVDKRYFNNVNEFKNL